MLSVGILLLLLSQIYITKKRYYISQRGRQRYPKINPKITLIKQGRNSKCYVKKKDPKNIYHERVFFAMSSNFELL
jgi:hypothetical protein